eukprot:5592913-Pyramimonas_sp.AAC.1
MEDVVPTAPIMNRPCSLWGRLLPLLLSLADLRGPPPLGVGAAEAPARKLQGAGEPRRRVRSGEAANPVAWGCCAGAPI